MITSILDFSAIDFAYFEIFIIYLTFLIEETTIYYIYVRTYDLLNEL